MVLWYGILLLLLPFQVLGKSDSWASWWTYEGISGPAYWGLINPAWTMCNKGRAQSPVNIDPGSITFDGTLTQLHADKHQQTAKMENTGQTLLVTVSESESAPVNITGGPLQYTYRFTEIILHWGKDGQPGSEHSINHHSFPAEVQVFGYNSDLYPDMEAARKGVRGLVAISLMVQVADDADRRQTGDHKYMGLGSIIGKLTNVQFSGEVTTIPQLSLASILPSTGEYVTYEGSTTYPGCWETVTWILMNKPVYLLPQEMALLHGLSQATDNRGGEQSGLGGNLRPRQNLNRRTVRTNIDHRSQTGDCEVQSSTERQFQANAWVREIPSADLLSSRYQRGFF